MALLACSSTKAANFWITSASDDCLATAGVPFPGITGNLSPKSTSNCLLTCHFSVWVPSHVECLGAVSSPHGKSLCLQISLLSFLIDFPQNSLQIVNYLCKMEVNKESDTSTSESVTEKAEEISESLAEKQAKEIHAVNALALLATYLSSSDSESDSETSSSSSSSSSSESGPEEVVITNTTTYREAPQVIEDSSNDEASDNPSDEESEGKPKAPNQPSRHRTGIKAKGELDLVDLPPIEELNINVREEECLLLGRILSIVEQMVLVEATRGGAVLDLDTVLFVERGHRVLGRIFDVLGPIDQPIYCIRFNSPAEIKSKAFTTGMEVFWVAKPEHSSIVVVPNLMQQKGSDASWEHDIEPPEGCLDYSDDEQEKASRRSRKQHKEPTQRQVLRGQRRWAQQPRAPPPNLNWYQYPPPTMPTWGPVFVNPFAYQANVPFMQPPPPPPPPQSAPPVKVEPEQPPPPGCN
ncbi:H/ACA ribonucleoprotein complex non-core subunit NAF1 [Phlebotomus argentipes]|uniref:H/ACA ribonucleoprotein complex non-core subunit NAF1 n=1 Tax=Phlebotomus argentipes TaxID=94469 RepID=UPI0028930DA4|nr:H/ACA ribonucleoprotein complex non-core subunit NAF1 [Phlebotomus argentipes]